LLKIWYAILQKLFTLAKKEKIENIDDIEENTNKTALQIKLCTSRAGSSRLASQAYRAEPSRSSQSTRLGSFEPSF
jgi:hypothetical protein